MMPSPSRNHWTSEPVIAIEPSSAYVAGSSPIRYPTVVSSPWLDQTGCLPGVEQQEAAGAVGALGLAGRKAGLPEQGGLLVAERGGDLHAREDGRRDAVDLGRGTDLRQHRAGHVEERQQLIVPVEGFQVHQHRAAGIRDVGDVHAAVRAAGEVPDQPALHGAEQDLATSAAARNAVDVVQDPLQIAGRRSRSPAATREAPNNGATSVALQLGGDPVGAGVLPDDGVAVGLAGVPVPHHRRLALVGDADGGDLVDRDTAGGSAGGATRSRLRQISIASCSTQPGFGKC